ncbi:sterol desaturase family protein [Roseovarius sp. SYSU LYC5161]|jgi:sterol desaturase/sphingolipid hydroxylase (fatty acid hydroxylase superfamily)|uniref:sterol desaturase family protein n=1 Tax=Roseovarius halophilus (ex Wu et al. 2025) TaxID=3376060 RepID=UPI002870C20D|nr:sterol desaturase family protein [Roseovarius sp.]
MENEAIIRVGVFLGLFALFATIEALLPRRQRSQPRRTRWFTNWSIVIIDTIALRLLAIVLPLLAVGAAFDAGEQGWGLFNRVDIAPWLAIVLTILVFDLAIWAQHLVTHKVPFLWRIHRVHHADRDMDVTTAIRFHPVEIALSMLIKIGLVYMLGAPALGVILFEIILNGTAMFNHANIRLPASLDAAIRQVLVTPDMHRVHHSVHRHEHDSNYGFALSIWDRVFGTYIPQPEKGHDQMTTGLDWQDDRPSRLGWSLALPFRRK